MIKNKLPLVLIILLALFLRVYGVNWDQGFHLHPDERMLIMVTDRLKFFNQLNPDFFNYGSLPIYILRASAQLIDTIFRMQISNYVGMLYLGRYLSIIFDIGTIILIYKISRLLFNNIKIQIYSTLFYSVAFFPIQNSHFFVVDVFLTFFTTLLLLLLLKYLLLPSWSDRPKMVVVHGIVFAAMLSTKFTAIIFLPIISLILIFKNRNSLRKCIFDLLFFYLLSSIFFFIFMPYAFIEYKRFISDISEQIKMNNDPYIFPYTLQYVSTIPYLYYLRNIFFWGLGPLISTLSLLGLIFFVRYQILKIKYQKHTSKIKYFIFNMNFLYFIFYILYFIVIGRSAVKFMRYMLPIYPFLTIMAGYGLFQISNIKYQITKLLTFSFLLFTFVWSYMFINIYSQKHTRISATEWILQNIPVGSRIAIEHWDDGLPLFAGENYKHVELPLYGQPDDEKKWQEIKEKLNSTEYIIIASNRLYVPLQKLSDCKKYRACYPKTAEYYRKLFNQQLGFKKVAEFAVYPKLEVGSWKLEVDDQSADESFTVYDHPKIMIFKKI
ncbi:hypothetical protein A2859_01220 [Candidatus Roizmanbacteria bacterium RIFCSPHIGHO2_01_FULL_37_16b]|nr:MAG: hypothetical protein A2859_01220 [Candidatus Roizmanbacteria bacterium RIFCSPHIGHO2_01_FULL_37_16b]OGK33093.1 MAG: hypothetical protein A3F57_05985 [Candidatus Roizmanbacteria bacterium RIFCSPHIGHO2_12_FULL_36_11]